jgi:hypothetical protein
MSCIDPAEPAGGAFVGDVQPVAGTHQPAQCLGDSERAARYSAQATRLDLTRGLGQRDLDAVLVNVQLHVQSARLTHGPSP